MIKCDINLISDLRGNVRKWSKTARKKDRRQREFNGMYPRTRGVNASVRLGFTYLQDRKSVWSALRVENVQDLKVQRMNWKKIHYGASMEAAKLRITGPLLAVRDRLWSWYLNYAFDRINICWNSSIFNHWNIICILCNRKNTYEYS